MWALSLGQDRMRLQESKLLLEARRTVLEILAGNPVPADIPLEGCLLYCCSNRVEFAGQMPPFDEWGLRPVGLEGSRENPVTVVPLLVAGAELAPRVDAGGQASPEAGGAGGAPLEPPQFLRRQLLEPTTLALRK